MKVYEQILFTKDECDFIIKYCNENIIPKPVINGIGVKYDYFKVLYNEDIKWVFDKIYNSFESITHIPVKDKTNQISVNRYNIGNGFAKHIDRDSSAPQRMWNTGVMLNTDYSGGEYYYYIDGIRYEFKKEIGNFIIYDSAIPHQISKVTDGVRLSIVKILDLEHLEYKTNSLI